MKPRKPIPRRRKKARAYKTPRCIGIVGTSTRCKKPQEHLSRCRHHLLAYLDGLWGEIVRTGRCELAALHAEFGFRCGGNVCACHGFDRSEMPTRWDPRNGFSGCGAANKWADDYRVRWYLWCGRHWGAALHADLSALVGAGASGRWRPDYEEIERNLRAALAARKEAAG